MDQLDRFYSLKGDFFANYFMTGEHTKNDVLKNLKHSPYDRCVFNSDNDVCDHQVTAIRFKNGKTAIHTMTAFSKDIYRDIKIYGTKGELVGVMEDNYIEIRPFNGEIKRIHIDTSKANVGGHMGGDFFMMNELFKELNGEKSVGITYLDESIESHLMCFAAEESRNNDGKQVRFYER